MTIQELIRNFKEKTGCTNDFIAKKTGVTKSTVSRWISGDIKNIQEDTLECLSLLLGIDIHEKLKESNYFHRKPILGIVKAGYDLFAEENVLGYEDVSDKDHKLGDYFLKVVGDSMIGAKINDGDLLYVKACHDVTNGDIAIVLIGDEVTVKRIIKKEDMLILEAANAMVANRYFTNEEAEELSISIIGKAVYSKTEFL